MGETIFREYLCSKGLKLTKERFAVLDEILNVRGHFEPEELYVRIRNAGSKASRASVYRTLNLLVESGIVQKVLRGDRSTIYEHTSASGHHDHLICHACGKIIEFYSGKIEALQDEICKSNNFSGVSHTLEIKGYCGQCKNTP